MPGTPIRARPVVMMWFRRDLRLAHHPALAAAAADGTPVIPLFVDDPAFDAAGPERLQPDGAVGEVRSGRRVPPPLAP